MNTNINAHNVCLLNADFSLLGMISVKKAIKLMCKKRVEVLKATDTILYNFERSISIAIPLVIKLIKYIRTVFRNKVPFSKRAVQIRDGHVCQYCNKKIIGDGSIDHVIPKSRGGLSTFDNCVASCLKCNHLKDNRLPAEAKMWPKTKPTTPTINEFILKSVSNLGINSTLRELGII